MSFTNQALLYGLAAIAIPIILHLLNRRSAKQIEWGAMQFLLDSVESRRRRIQLEEALLLAARCLLVGLVALAVARPFQPPGGMIPYVVVIPAFLLALVCLTTGIILRESKKHLFSLVGLGLALLALCAGAILYEKYWNLKRYGSTGKKDIVLIIDGSTSMQLKKDGMSNFDRAILEAKEVIEKSSGGNAFSVILGGPTPMVRVGDPMVNKSELDLALNSLKPVRGKMDAFACLSASLTALNRGSNGDKEIIVFTDEQAIGWNLDNRSDWEALQHSAKQLKAKPPIIVRKYELPAAFRNVAVAQIRLSRDTVGTDRPVGVEVTVENTGSEAISPTAVELTLGEPAEPGQPADAAKPAPQVLKDASMGQLQPGEKETIRFQHHFKEPGSVVLSARVVVQDDLALDDRADMSAHIVDRLSVLIVEGNPAADVLKRAASFTTLALAPMKQLAADPAPDPNAKSKSGVLIDPEVKTLGQLPLIASFQDYDVVILCDVPRLAESTARRLAAWVQAGGGLLISPGAQAEAAFYDSWRAADGTTVSPARLSSQTIVPPGQEPVGLALNTFKHPALRLVADAKQSDLGSAVFTRFWRLQPDESMEAAYSIARLANGDPFIASQRLGFGTVMLSAASFDPASGNLATRQSFVPLVHQLVYHLASPEGQPLHFQPARQINLPLSASRAEGGLKGEYFRGQEFKAPPSFVRIDPRSEANFGDKAPAPSVERDNFSVRWTGSLIPRYTDEYVFEGWGDDSIHVWVNDTKVINRGGDGRAKLEAGKPVSFRIDFEESNGNANYQLTWRTNNGQLQQKEIIPIDCLTPFQPDAQDKETAVGILEATGPDRAVRNAQLLFTRSGLVARLTGDIIPGIYHLAVPKDRQKEYERLLAKDGTIPFSVADDSTESRLTPFTDQETEFVKTQFEWLEPKTAKDVTNILAGREFGEELWKYLAVGALFILLAEIALTRWIALNRRSGEEVALDFENKFQAPKQFQEQLRRIQDTAGVN